MLSGGSSLLDYIKLCDWTHPKEKLPRLIPSFDPEGVVRVGVHVGCLDLEDVRWHGPICLDAHVFVDNGRWETLAVGLRAADAAAASTRDPREASCTADGKLTDADGGY